MKNDPYRGKYLYTNIITNYLNASFFNDIKLITNDLNINTILEVGCGYGFSTKNLANIFKDKFLEASDNVPDIAMEAKRLNPNIQIKTESIYNLNRADNSFDLVIALEVLEHLDNPIRALTELKRVTNRYCLISVPREPLWRIYECFAREISKKFW